ncbi:MAG: class I SAM-dependent rRNA methyltransferase [Aggregatilineales bacterium]
MAETAIIIKPGRDKPIINQHPWIFSGAIRGMEGIPEQGEIVNVRAHDRAFLGQGYWNVNSQIRVRMLSWDKDPIDDRWWRNALKRAIDARLSLTDADHNAERLPCRLINAESDFIPGLVVDAFEDVANNKLWLSLQALTLGIDVHKKMIAHHLVELLQEYAGMSMVAGIYERNDVDAREKEGLRQHKGVLWGEEPPERIQILHSPDIYYWVDIKNGHKTGTYLDQRRNHDFVLDFVNSQQNLKPTPNKKYEVLNLFSYTGVFGLAAWSDETTYITNVDSSNEALAIAEANVALNPEMVSENFEFVQADVFEYQRAMVNQGRQWDFVILDPPKFAHSKQQIDRASRGYKDINLNALHLIKPGGYLMTFSCSGAITPDLFQKIVFGALVDSGRQAQVIHHLGASDDHPVALTFPEGEYLKGLLLRIY